MNELSLRSFIDSYQRKFQDDVVIVDDEISTEYEPTAYYKNLEKKNPLIFFRNISGYPGFSLATNVMGSSARMAFALGVEEEGLIERWDEVMSSTSELKIQTGGPPVKEVRTLGSDVNLFDLPIPVHYSQDGQNSGFNRYITGGLALSRDPDNTETVNMSFTRIQPIDKDTYAFDMGSHGHLWNYVEKSRKRGVPIDISVMIGSHPVFYMLAASFIENEYKHAAALGDFKFSTGEMNDIPFPSESEIIIEAEVILDRSFQEGPFSEFTGYMSSRTTGNVAKIKSIMHRREPIFYDIAPSNSHEHVGLFSVPRSASITKGIRTYLPPSGGYSISWPLSSSHLIALCSVRNPEPGLAKQLGLSVTGLDALFTKIALISEGSTNPLSVEQFLLSLMKSDLVLGKNIVTIPDVFTIKLDPSSTKEGTDGKAIIITGGEVPLHKEISKEGSKILRTKWGDLEYSHSEGEESKITVLLDSDIALSDYDAITWAMATRTRPDLDISVDAGKLVIDARAKSDLVVPQLPPDVVDRVSKRILKK